MMLFLFSCKKEKDSITTDTTLADSEAPSVTLTNPDVGVQYEVGSTLSIKGIAVDNAELATFEWVIQGDVSSSYLGVLQGTGTLSGASMEFSENIPLPEDFSVGVLQVKVRVQDAQGNYSAYATVEVESVDSSHPTIEYPLPGYKVNIGDTVYFKSYENTHGLVDKIEMLNNSNQVIIRMTKLSGFEHYFTPIIYEASGKSYWDLQWVDLKTVVFTAGIHQRMEVLQAHPTEPNHSAGIYVLDYDDNKNLVYSPSELSSYTHRRYLTPIENVALVEFN